MPTVIASTVGAGPTRQVVAVKLSSRELFPLKQEDVLIGSKNDFDAVIWQPREVDHYLQQAARCWTKDFKVLGEWRKDGGQGGQDARLVINYPCIVADMPYT